MNHTERKRAELIGTTYGLAASTCSSKDHTPEQIYVKRTGDPDRPVNIQGWVGYGTTDQIKPTRRQMFELIGLLTQALAEFPPDPTEMSR